LLLCCCLLLLCCLFAFLHLVDDDFAMLWLVLLLMMKVLREGVVGLLQLIVVSFITFLLAPLAVLLMISRSLATPVMLIHG